MTPAPDPTATPVGGEVHSVWIVVSPKGVPQPYTCRDNREGAMAACFGRREYDRYPRDWWQHNIDEGWTCREIALSPSASAEVAGVAEVERENAVLRAALSALPAIAEECRIKWDAGMKAGKLLIALTDPTLRYRSDITELHRVAALPTKQEVVQAATIVRQADELRGRDAELERLREAVTSVEWRGENKAYADVFQAAMRVYAHPGNDLSDRRAVRTFAERFQARAILNDAPPRSTPDRPEGGVEGGADHGM